jgi:hypothetical protein
MRIRLSAIWLSGLCAGVLSVLMPGRAAEAAPAPRLTWHFAGTHNLAGGTDGELLRKALAQPATVQVMQQAWEKLATAPQRLATNAIKDVSVDLAAILRPAIADLAGYQSVGVWQGPLEWAVAIETGAEAGDRWAADWEKTARAFGAGDPEPVEAGNAELKVARGFSDGGDVATACGRLGNWVGVAVGTDPVARLQQIAAETRTTLETGTDAWLEFRGNPRALTGCELLPDADVRLSLTGAADRVRTVATMTFAEPLDLELDSWELPTDAIREPLIGFAAGRGLADLLARLPVLDRAEMKPLPNQVCIWSLGLHPTQTYFAWPAAEAKGALKRVAPVLKEEFQQRLPALRPAEVVYQPELNRAVITNMINAIPFVEAAPGVAPDHLVAGLSLPLYLGKDAGPEPLFEQVRGRSNLVWFDWEITQPRLEMMWHLRTYAAMVSGYLPLPAGGAVNSWLRDSGFTGCLGNTATEITLESPTELKVVRASAVGFTAFELTRLAVWLDGEDFPLSTQPRTIFDRRRSAAGAPAGPTPAEPRNASPSAGGPPGRGRLPVPQP